MDGELVDILLKEISALREVPDCSRAATTFGAFREGSGSLANQRVLSEVCILDSEGFESADDNLSPNPHPGL